jgi:hypothetical protein
MLAKRSWRATGRQSGTSARIEDKAATIVTVPSQKNCKQRVWNVWGLPFSMLSLGGVRSKQGRFTDTLALEKESRTLCQNSLSVFFGDCD